jgi:DNA uptake protein ComE-like DNA-binding protein
VPRREDYKSENLPVGDGAFWFIGRDLDQRATNEPVFGLVDEASKLNLKTASRTMLEALPTMTPELAEAIIQWRTRNAAGSGDSTYGRLDPPRSIKAGQFESVDELRLVYGATLDILFGEDTNRNGALDDNENDNEQSAPRDNQDGLLQAGILEFVTVYSQAPNTRASGGRRINVTNAQQRPQLNQVLGQRISPQRAAQIMGRLNQPGVQIRSVAEFMNVAQLTAEEYVAIRTEISHRDGATVTGLVNVNTASETVLACLPGMTPDNAAALVAYRQQHPDLLTNFHWIQQILSRTDIGRVGPYLTDQSYQFSADVAAVGPGGRGYCREKTIFDMSRGTTPRIIYHQDLTSYGWALGTQARQTFRDAKENRT